MNSGHKIRRSAMLIACSSYRKIINRLSTLEHQIQMMMLLRQEQLNLYNLYIEIRCSRLERDFNKLTCGVKLGELEG